MGTINYMTSKYITLAVKPYDFEDIRQGIIDDILSGSYEHLTIEELTDDFVNETISSYYGDDRDNATAIIDRYNMNYFDIHIEHGYYEGLSIKIDDNLPDKYDIMYEYTNVFAEVSKLRECLKDLAGVGFCACSPSWCTTYYNYTETLGMIDEAIKSLKDDVKNVMIEAQSILAHDFVESIKSLAENQDNLDNIECYLSNHFAVWVEKFAYNPMCLCDELKRFAHIS